MALYQTPEEHAANPPASWTVHRAAGRGWDLRDQRGVVIDDSYPTKRAAIEASSTGPLVKLYDKERRWFAGEPVPGWTPYTPPAATAPVLDPANDRMVAVPAAVLDVLAEYAGLFLDEHSYDSGREDLKAGRVALDAALTLLNPDAVAAAKESNR